jgi:hypothetical protein
MNTEPRAYEHFNKFNDISYERKKFNLRTFNLQTHFKEHIMFVSWGSPVLYTTFGKAESNNY